MPEIDDLVRALDTPPAPEVAPAWGPDPVPWWRRRWVVGPALALAVLVLVLGRGATDSVETVVDEQPSTRVRGTETAPAVGLQLAIERDGEALVAAPGATYRLGDRVLFRVSRAEQGPVRLLAVGPAGPVSIATVSASPEPRQVTTDDGLVAWEFDVPGTWTFQATGGVGDDCVAPGCAHETLRVE